MLNKCVHLFAFMSMFWLSLIYRCFYSCQKKVYQSSPSARGWNWKMNHGLYQANQCICPKPQHFTMSCIMIEYGPLRFKKSEAHSSGHKIIVCIPSLTPTACEKPKHVSKPSTISFSLSLLGFLHCTFKSKQIIVKNIGRVKFR